MAVRMKELRRDRCRPVPKSLDTETRVFVDRMNSLV